MNLIPSADPHIKAIHDALATLLLASGGAGTGITLDATSSIDGVTGAQILADHATTASSAATLTAIQAAWTSFTPSWTNVTVGNGTNVGYYLLIGKTLFVSVVLTFGTTTAITSNVSVTIPASKTAVSTRQQLIQFTTATPGTVFCGIGSVPASATAISPFLPVSTSASNLAALGSFGITYGSGATLILGGAFEVA